MVLPRVLWCRLRGVQDDALAEQVEAGPAVHLALDHLDLVDGALGPAGVPVQGEAVDDCLLVVADAGGEGAQACLFAGFDGGGPGFEVAAAGAGGHHLGKCGHVPGERADVRAAGADGLDLGLLAWPEVVGTGQQPASDLAGSRDRGKGVRGGGDLPEWPDVTADGLLAAGPAELLQSSVERSGAGDAFVPPLVQVRLELIQLRFPAGGLARQFARAAGPGEPLHGLAVQPVTRLIADSDSPASSRPRISAWRSRVRVTRRRSRPHASSNPSGGTCPASACPGGSCSAVPAGPAAPLPPGWSFRQPRWPATVFPAYSARLCHRCQRSATWIASGAPARAPSA